MSAELSKLSIFAGYADDALYGGGVAIDVARRVAESGGRSGHAIGRARAYLDVALAHGVPLSSVADMRADIEALERRAELPI